MEQVLQLLPQRQTMVQSEFHLGLAATRRHRREEADLIRTDQLVNIFTHDVNYHYYIIYPPEFLREYHIWWERRSKGRPITLQYTCLLAMICACCVQHADKDMSQKL